MNSAIECSCLQYLLHCFVFLHIDRDPNAKSGGELFLGGKDEAHYTGDFFCVDLQEETYWKIKVDG